MKSSIWLKKALYRHFEPFIQHFEGSSQNFE